MNTFQLIIFGMLTGIVTGEFVERKTTQRPTIYFYRWYYLPPGRHATSLRKEARPRDTPLKSLLRRKRQADTVELESYPGQLQHDAPLDLDRLLEVLGPTLFALPFLLPLVPLALPAIPLALWAEEAYKQERADNNGTTTENEIP